MAEDKKNLFDDILFDIKGMHADIAAFIPAIEAAVNAIIESHSTDKQEIEHLLDTLTSITPVGLGHALFIKLLEYYKTVDSKGADFYWHLYEDMNE